MAGRNHSLDTLEQERWEVLKSVLVAIATTQPDPDRTAACNLLLQHLFCNSSSSLEDCPTLR